MIASLSKQQAATNAIQTTNPVYINTNFSLNGKPKPDEIDHENKLPATVGETDLERMINCDVEAAIFNDFSL